MAAIADVWQLLQPWLRTEGVEGTRGAPTHSTGLHPLRTGGAEGAHEAPANSTELHPLRTEGAGGPQGGAMKGGKAPPPPSPPGPLHSYHRRWLIGYIKFYVLRAKVKIIDKILSNISS